MRRLPSLCAATLAALVLSQASSVLATEVTRTNAIVTAVKNSKDSIVTIKITKASGAKEVAGTGVVVDERGLIVTNKHVIGSGRGVVVAFADGAEVSGDVLMADPRFDLAIVRVKAGKTLPAMRLTTAQDLMVGEDVIAIGHPYGYVNTVSRGIISALGRQITLPSGDVLEGLIQTDASINPGNSGGPLLNINGELIGINVALREGANGIAFAINAGTVQTVLSKHFSALKVSGVMHGLKTEERVLAQTGDRQKLEVKENNGPLKAGDMIVTVNNKAVANSFDLERSFWGKKPGEAVEVKVLREGRVVTASLTLASAQNQTANLGQGAGHVAQAAPAITPMPRPAATNGVVSVGLPRGN